MIPYGKQHIDTDDVNGIISVLNSNFLTTGPKITEFEQAITEYTESKYCTAVSNGTAALHLACIAIGIKEGDEVIVPAISFVATSNSVLYCNGTPIFCDVEKHTLNIDPDKIEPLITEHTKAIITVDFAGNPCNYNKIIAICQKYNLVLIEDASHAIGSLYMFKNKQLKIGNIADITTFSFHPVKNITSTEGGALTTNNKIYDELIKKYRSHGISVDYKMREQTGCYNYDMEYLGFNYRLNDISCSLGITQLKKIEYFKKRRQEIVALYNNKLSSCANIIPLVYCKDTMPHIYIVKVNNRDNVFKLMRDRGINVNVHYKPIYLHSYYRNQDRYKNVICPIAEEEYNKILTLPLFVDLTNCEIDKIVSTLIEICTN